MAACLDTVSKIFELPKYDKSIEETAQRLNENLPIRLLPSDIQANPGLTKLLASLSQFIGPDGLTVGIKNDYQQAKNSIKNAKENWLQKQILYDELQELLIDHQLKVIDSTPSTNTQFYDAVSEMLVNAEIHDHLDCSLETNSKNSLLKLTQDDLDRNNPHKKHLQSIQQKLIPEMESRLRKRCETLVSFHDPQVDVTAGNLDRFSFAKASQLPAILEAEQQSLELEKAQLKKERIDRQFQFSKYYESLMESLQLLTELITKHRLQLSPDYNQITFEWLIARVDAMCFKIKVIELQLMYDTYYNDSVNALNVIRRELNLSIQETHQELARASNALHVYESVGRDFDLVVQEFTRIRDELDNKKWALHELKKHRISDELMS